MGYPTNNHGGTEMITLAAAATLCLTYSDMVALLGDQYNERETVVSLADQGGAVVTFVSPTGGTWTMVVVNPDKTTCVVATGTDFQVVIQ
jgi:hypothetical protein